MTLREPFLRASLKFEPRDLWVGVYWNFDSISRTIMTGFFGGNFHKYLAVYICILPMLPIKLEFRWGFKS